MCGFLKPQVAKNLVFHCDSKFRPVVLTPMYAMINPYVVFCPAVCVCVCIGDGVKVWVGPWRGFKFSVS